MKAMTLPAVHQGGLLQHGHVDERECHSDKNLPDLDRGAEFVMDEGYRGTHIAVCQRV